MARKRFWLAVAPITYAVRKKVHDMTGVLRRRYAQRTWIETTSRTTYLVRGSGPQSFVTCIRLDYAQWKRFHSNHTSGCALMMAIRRVLWGSSVYVQKKWSCSFLAFGSCCFSPFTVKLRGTGSFDGTVAVETEDRMLGSRKEQLQSV